MRWLTVLLFVWLVPAAAIDPTEPLPDAEQQALYEQITAETRCLVCQNQTIADSTAPLAADLRREIRKKVAAGQSEEEIKNFLVERYGDFILYKPLFRSWNIVLWLGPPLLVVIGFFALRNIVARRSQLPINEDAP
jgi:cytochrome c-type biogenesis protein CcmH